MIIGIREILLKLGKDRNLVREFFKKINKNLKGKYRKIR
jgi:hypothetical protein